MCFEGGPEVTKIPSAGFAGYFPGKNGLLVGSTLPSALAEINLYQLKIPPGSAVCTISNLLTEMLTATRVAVV